MSLRQLEIQAPGLQLLLPAIPLSPSLQEFQQFLHTFAARIEATACFKSVDFNLSVRNRIPIPDSPQACLQRFRPQNQLHLLKVVPKPKTRYYLSLSQELDRSGKIGSRAKVGFRNLTGKFDSFQVQIQKYLLSDRNNIQLNYRVPDIIKGTSTTVSYAQGMRHLSLSLKQHFNTSTLSYQLDTNTSLHLQHSFRNPKVQAGQPGSAVEVNEGMFCPSNRFAFKVNKTLLDSTSRHAVHSGHHLQTNFQVPLALISQSKALKLSLSGRSYKDLYDLSRSFEKGSMGRVLKSSVVEQAGSLSLVLWAKGASDLYQEAVPRNFIANNSLNYSNLLLNYSLKLNVYDFPLLSRAGFFAFFYSQLLLGTGFTPKASHASLGLGYGLGYEFNQAVRLQLTGGLLGWSWQNKLKKTSLQIRLGIFD